jgi:hypothetical protein
MVRNPRADGPHGTNIAETPRPNEVNPLNPSPDLPNDLSSWDEIWGRCEASLGDAMPKKLRPQTYKIAENRSRTELYQKARVPPETLKSKAKSRVWGVKIKHKDAQGSYPWSPQRNSNPDTSESEEQATHENPTKIARKKTEKSLEPQEGNRRNHESFHTLRGQILYKPVKKI